MKMSDQMEVDALSTVITASGAEETAKVDFPQFDRAMELLEADPDKAAQAFGEIVMTRKTAFLSTDFI